MSLSTRTQHMGLAALIMSAGILLSRFMGLIRDKVISWRFGATGEADLYFAAFVVPDFINYLLAGGYVSITLIPLLAKRFEEDENDAWRFFGAVFRWALLAVGLLTAAAWLAALPLARIAAPGFDEERILRLAGFLRIILPGQIFFVAGACFSALLFYRRQFFIPALTPLIYNGAIILGGLLLPLLHPTAGMEGFCWGVSVGAAAGAFALPWWAARRGGLRLPAVWRHPLMGRFLLIALPLMLGQSIVMLNEQFLRIFGSLAGEGVVSLLNYARRISQAPEGIIGQAVAVASYPFLASLAAKNDGPALAGTLRAALSAGLSLALPLAAWMLAAARPVMGLIFEGGRFGAADAAAAAQLLQVMLPCVPLWVIQAVLGRGFYAHGDTLTPALVGTTITILSLPFFYACLPWGAMGIVMVSSTAVAAYVAAIMLIWRRRRGGAAFAGLGGICAKAGGLSLPAALAAWGTETYCRSALSVPQIWNTPLSATAGAAVFCLCYAVLARRLAPELLTPFTRRLRRSQSEERHALHRSRTPRGL